MELIDKVLGPIELKLEIVGGNLQVSGVLSAKQLLDMGIKLLPVSLQPAAEAIEAVVEAGIEKL